jgi:pullulanase
MNRTRRNMSIRFCGFFLVLIILSIQAVADALPNKVEASPALQTDIVIPQSPTADAPQSVTIAGTVQSVLGCPNDWDPSCETTFMTYDAEDDLWKATFDLPAGEYEYKAALNGGWEVSIGQNGNFESGSANIALSLTEDSMVTFIYNHKTGYVFDSINQIIANVPGNYQDEIGCPGEWQPTCLRTILEDPDGDGIYTYLAIGIPAGGYEAKVAFNESWTLNYGADGAQDGPDILFDVPESGMLTVFNFNTADNVMTIETVPAPEGMEMPEVTVVRGNLKTAQAYWVDQSTILWNARDAADDTAYQLQVNLDGNLELSGTGVERGVELDLTVSDEPLSDALTERFPHLANLTVLKLPEEELDRVPALLRGQVAVAAVSPDGMLLDATALQTAGVLDDLYTNDEVLGVSWDESGLPTIRVWAPTAKNVSLHLFADADPETQAIPQAMTRDEATGVWTVTGESDWLGQYYLFQVQVFVRTTGNVETNLVTDPYSLSLTQNSTRSQLIDLSSDELKPEGWDTLEKPELAAPEDITVYELHVRDFSIFDESVSEEHRGKFLAFTETESDGMQHLIALAEAGLSHLHLLPAFDIATINENAEERVEPDVKDLASYPPDSDQQQAIIVPIRDQDGFNWGYDPYHYTVPEGSYSTNPEDTTRIVEFRQMVQALNENGLRVVMDVVYNHTNSAGQAERSVLDKIVPDYYYRLDENGNVTTSTCCPNTASEHNMMEKLMIDSLIVWATEYKIDGFRFDLMGHHMLRNMESVRAALDALTLEDDGVDGKSIYIYGEGWNFGEVQDNARGVNATQLNVGGTGIGTFSDRLRDAVRGGNPFGGLQEQGFINGLYVNPNGITPGTEAEQLDRLLLFSDQIRVGLAGNLADYTFTDRTGEEVTGADVPYGASPTGYTLDPQEHIVYIDKHDNETLFDIIQLKAPLETSMEDRVRMQNLGNSIIMLSQGVPFYQAGTDLLRSKSLDRNSYNSGDWFNALDFSYEENNWGKGLPLSTDNSANYAIFAPLLANPGLKPTEEDILRANEHFQEMLQVRYSSPLFRLQTAEQIQAMLSFQNTGPDQIAGVIVMTLTDEEDLDPDYEQIVVIFNATPESVTLTDEMFVDQSFELHPILTASSDEIVQTSTFDAENASFDVPALTTAVFVME